LIIGCSSVGASDTDIEPLPGGLSGEFEYIFSLVGKDGQVDPEQLSGIVDFVRSLPADKGYSLAKRRGGVGAFYAFDVTSDFSDFIGYSFNPDIPPYVTSPSSLQHQSWLTPETAQELRKMISGDSEVGSMHVLRGQDNSTITPDINTGAYYTYSQERLLAFLPDPAGPILVTASVQDDKSDIGRKGCVVGDDTNWNYLYTDTTGLTKEGFGWVNSFMYKASAICIYITDAESGTIRVGTFKWLNAGWSRINMVKSHHILKGIKRFAQDFKNILESPNLPEIDEIAERYRELQTTQEQELRQLVAPYLDALMQSQQIEECSDTFVSLVSSGKYLAEMDSQEIVRILLLEYLKGNLDSTGAGNVGYRTVHHDSVPVDS